MILDKNYHPSPIIFLSSPHHCLKPIYFSINKENNNNKKNIKVEKKYIQFSNRDKKKKKKTIHYIDKLSKGEKSTINLIKTMSED